MEEELRHRSVFLKGVSLEGAHTKGMELKEQEETLLRLRRKKTWAIQLQNYSINKLKILNNQIPEMNVASFV